MSKLSQHKYWIFWLLAAIFALVVGSPTLEYLHKNELNQETKQTLLQKELSTSLQQLRKDAQDAQQLGKAMDEATASAILAPVDRSKIAIILEQQAAGADLINFTYSISPIGPVADNSITITTKDLAISTISLQADAPADVSVYRFISSIKKNVPGRLKLQQLQISRTSVSDDAPLGPTNVKIMAKLEWLYNNPAENKP